MSKACGGGAGGYQRVVLTFDDIVESVRRSDGLLRAAYDREMKLQAQLAQSENARMWWMRAMTALVDRTGTVIIDHACFMALGFKTSIEVIEGENAVMIRTHRLRVGQA